MSKKKNGVRYSLKKAAETKRDSDGLLWNRDKMKNRRGYVINPFSNGYKNMSVQEFVNKNTSEKYRRMKSK